MCTEPNNTFGTFQMNENLCTNDFPTYKLLQYDHRSVKAVETNCHGQVQQKGPVWYK